jgi:hypothetical protein
MTFLLAPLMARAQAIPSASKSQFSVSAGALGSVFQPDYAGGTTAKASPRYLYGVGTYVDVRFTRWIQIEGEGRWSRFNQYYGINESTYQIGPRVPLVTFHRLTPYGKVLAGMGTGSFLTGHSFVFTGGGGVDYQLTRRITLRAIDFEYQRWRVDPTLYPYGASVGVSYKVF